jgi:hypothetical protein
LRGRTAAKYPQQKVIELSDEVLVRWEKISQERRKRAASSAIGTAVITTIPGRQPPPPAGTPIQDYSKQHALLEYSDEQFVTTPVSDMLLQYRCNTRCWCVCILV